MMMWIITVKEIVEVKKWSGDFPSKDGSPPTD